MVLIRFTLGVYDQYEMIHTIGYISVNSQLKYDLNLFNFDPFQNEKWNEKQSVFENKSKKIDL